MKPFIFLLALLLTGSLSAHQSEISTTMLVEREAGSWQLYVNTSLTAFEYEVREHFGEHAFATPGEFRELVLQHLRNTISVTFNGNEPAVLAEGRVELGHETGVVFTVTDLPDDAREVRVVNTAFADIHRNKSALVILKQGSGKQQFELTADNDHTAALAFDGYRLSKVAPTEASVSPLAPLLLVLGVLAAFFWLGVKRVRPQAG
ncbi:hypothetical protein [Lewinella sp. JB7]|uniref:hypothetical protein n=1 Tax=Lewinella sp. JB7 TaxID=2962887 RepID=UPI0020C99EA5|nr:hypothetical protein [Lewinella sp. JB7]MCP9234720.1 hypothetical protein [Lewinella sp. JB7]